MPRPHRRAAMFPDRSFRRARRRSCHAPARARAGSAGDAAHSTSRARFRAHGRRIVADVLREWNDSNGPALVPPDRDVESACKCGSPGHAGVTTASTSVAGRHARGALAASAASIRAAAMSSATAPTPRASCRHGCSSCQSRRMQGLARCAQGGARFLARAFGGAEASTVHAIAHIGSSMSQGPLDRRSRPTELHAHVRVARKRWITRSATPHRGRRCGSPCARDRSVPVMARRSCRPVMTPRQITSYSRWIARSSSFAPGGLRRQRAHDDQHAARVLVERCTMPARGSADKEGSCAAGILQRPVGFPAPITTSQPACSRSDILVLVHDRERMTCAATVASLRDFGRDGDRLAAETLSRGRRKRRRHDLADSIHVSGGCGVLRQ